MNKNIKFKIVIGILISIIVLSISNITNAFSIRAEMSADKSLEAGKEILVTVNIKDLDVGKGIDAFMGTINYDKNVFETLKSENLVSTNGWNPVFNPSTNIFTLLNNSKVLKESAILVIKFKVKSSLTEYNTEVKLTNMSASGGAVADGGTGDINLSNSSLTISRAPLISTNTSNTNNNTQKAPDEKSNGTIKTSNETKNQGDISNVNIAADDNAQNTNLNEENNNALDLNELEINLLDENNIAQNEIVDLRVPSNKIVFVVIGILLIIAFIIGYIKYKSKKINKE